MANDSGFSKLDRAALMREHAAARSRRAAAAAGSSEWRSAAADVARIEVQLASITALKTPPARVARPEEKRRA
jgi:hypothetical protein